MSYEPLALKYRPRAFADLVGQEHVTGGLQAAIDGGRIAHAYLFCGPRGTGKTTTARILARCLNCEKGLVSDPCGHCDACRAVIAGASLDVMELDAASQRKVEDTEDWITTVHLVPAGRHKVYIVDEVHMFSKASFNLLLKTFEEPPAHAVFVLATTEPEKVPATVRGRCQRFDFRLVPHDVLVARYHVICEAEGIEPEPDALELVARQAAGSVRDGLTLMEQALSDDGHSLAMTRVQALIGAVDRALVVEAAELMVGHQPEGVFSLVARVMAAGADLRRFAEDLVAYLRGVMVVASGARPERLLDGVDDTLARAMARHGDAMTAEGATDLLVALAQVAPDVDNENLGRITLEAALVRCCLGEIGAGEGLAARVTALEARLSRAPGMRPAGDQKPAAELPARPPAPLPEPSPSPADRPRPSEDVPGKAAQGTPAEPLRPDSVPDDAPLVVTGRGSAEAHRGSTEVSEASGALADERAGVPGDSPGSPLASGALAGQGGPTAGDGRPTTGSPGDGSAPTPDVPVAELEARWRDVTRSVGAVVRALLDGSRPLGLERSLLRVGVDQEFKAKRLTERQDEITAIVAQAFGSEVRPTFEVLEEFSAPDESRPEANPTELPEGGAPEAISVVELVKRGFAAEVVEEYGSE